MEIAIQQHNAVIVIVDIPDQLVTSVHMTCKVEASPLYFLGGAPVIQSRSEGITQVEALP